MKRKIPIMIWLALVLMLMTYPAFAQDSDNDGVLDSLDNCVNEENGSVLGTCAAGNNVIITNCTTSDDCGTGGNCPFPPCNTSDFCTLNQEDADGDTIGDACDCNYQGVDLPGCLKSFADAVVSYTHGVGVGDCCDDPGRALGPPDYTNDEWDGNFVSLGDEDEFGAGGELVVAFIDNALTTSGDNAKDLWIFEPGLAEGTDIYVSKDGQNWIYVGTAQGNTYGMDLDAYIGSGIVLDELYTYVKIVDLPPPQNVSNWSGADIDAVAAIMSVPPPDTDEDGIPDGSDNCIYTPNGPNGGKCTAGEIGQACMDDECGTDGVCSMDQEDTDGDGLGDVCDNCLETPNGPTGGTCTLGESHFIARPCLANSECGIDGFCSMNQEDTDEDDIGDACDLCTGDLDCDDKCDAIDVTIFLEHFGRNPFNRPCTNDDDCLGDFFCDHDVDADDVSEFLKCFGRNPFNNPCPPCVFGPWCVYQE